ncbi:DNA repair protein RecN [Sporolactobacillus sp. THM7-7]|nr:DNA repair protein RecN [Sporolactobacillus sp. THM7-7]
MLLELEIVNFAIIKKQKISFENGLTVFTGETGAGKSIIIDAISLLTGGRGSAEYVRHGQSKAEIEGLFEVPDHSSLFSLLHSFGIDWNDGMIILHRDISSKGKSICRVNGKLVTLTVLREIGSKLVDIHGQHEHQLLLSQESHLPLIDRFGGANISELRTAYLKQYRRTAELARQCKAFHRNEKETARRIDLLQYQIEEIRTAELKPDEEERLLDEKKKLNSFEKVFHALQSSYEGLEGENKGLDALRNAVDQLNSVQDIDNELLAFSESVSNCYYILEEQTSSMRQYLEKMEYRPEKLDEVELRLNDIHLLKRKYGESIRKILDYLKKIQRERDELMHRDEKYEGINAALQQHLKTLKEKGLELSRARKKTVMRLNQAINSQLRGLYLEHAVFQAEIKQREPLESFQAYRADGVDTAEFFISTNPGEPLKPLEKIASGGELSRIMLAIKTAFKQVIDVGSIIFDEVDTGVSGRVAQAMAEKIFSLSKTSQVFCITHLPQMAAMADHHLYISKKVTENNRTSTTVRRLGEKEKIREIGRMISGAKMTDLTAKHAKELLKLAEKVKV